MTPPRVQRVAAYVVCVGADSRLLLCRLSGRTNMAGRWTLPGGGVEFGEHPEDAAIRELREETGLQGVLGELVHVDSASGPVRDGEGVELEMHRIRFFYRAEVEPAPLTHEVGGSSDLAQWFGPDEIAGITLVDVGRLGARLAWR